MPVVEQLDSVTIDRLRKQARFLQGIHQAEFDKDPSSRATEFARSNEFTKDTRNLGAVDLVNYQHVSS